ncbi:MAG: hypothetical protein ACJA16_004318, partial [Akkermansiaceae bacterium]
MGCAELFFSETAGAFARGVITGLLER